jgi:hypothetical protein
MDPFITNALVVFGTLALLSVPIAWLFPKIDRALGRLSDYLDARKAR